MIEVYISAALALVVAGVTTGILVMICLGTVYSWSVFTQPLIASFGWSNTTTTWAFSAAIFFLGAVQLLCLGILGEYLGRVYEEVKGRPIFTLKEAAGITVAPGSNISQPGWHGLPDGDGMDRTIAPERRQTRHMAPL